MSISNLRSDSTVLLDVDKSASLAYGVLTVKSSMHRGQFSDHTFVLIDKKRIVRYILDDEDMRIRNKELLKALASIT